MGEFRYTGIDQAGDEIRGSLDADTLLDAAKDLRGRGIHVYRLEGAEERGTEAPPEDVDAFSYFNRSLADLVRIGVPLPRALREVGAEIRDPGMRKHLDAVVAAVSEGQSMEDAIERGRGIFPAHYPAMVRAGAAAGNLPGLLLLMARVHEGGRQVRRSVEGALAYPVATVLFGFLLGLTFLFAYVPRVAEYVETRLWRTPWTLSLLDGIARHPLLAGLVALVVGLIGGRWVLRLWRSPRGETLLLRIPLLGEAMRSVLQARFLGALAELLAAGAQADDALSLALAASGSRILGDGREKMCARVRDGEAIGVVLGDVEVISPEVRDALAALGPDAARGMADLLLQRASAQCDALSDFLRPAAIVAAGILIGSGIVMAVWTAVDTLFH